MIFFCLTSYLAVIRTERFGRRGGELNTNSAIIGAVPATESEDKHEGGMKKQPSMERPDI